MMNKYIHKVNYYETDKMGITHHSNYIRFMEEARMSFLSEMGYPIIELEKKGVTSPVVSLNFEYIHSTTFDDKIEIEVSVSQYTGVKLNFSYTMKNVDTGDIVGIASSSHCLINRNGVPVIVKKYLPDFDLALKEICEKNKLHQKQ